MGLNDIHSYRIQNGIAIIRDLEYNVANDTQHRNRSLLWNLCLQEKPPINGVFPKEEWQFCALNKGLKKQLWSVICG